MNENVEPWHLRWHALQRHLARGLPVDSGRRLATERRAQGGGLRTHSSWLARARSAQRP